jgi:hypothetical protein
MIAEFQRNWEGQYKIKTSDQLQSVIDKRNTRNEKNAQTQRERNTVADMDEARSDGDDDDEGGNSEDDHGEYEHGSGSTGDGTVSQSKRSQTRNSNVQRRHSGCCTALPQVSHRPERQDQGSKGLSWCRQEPPGLYDIAEPC